MKIGIVGLGYVGLPLAVSFAEAGYEVIGLDLEPYVGATIEQGRITIPSAPGLGVTRA